MKKKSREPLQGVNRKTRNEKLETRNVQETRNSLTFFVGKGGVGKTTVSAAYAVWRARETHHRLLLLSTDPAHSLADVFAARIPSRPFELSIGSRRSVTVHQVNTQRQFGTFLDRYREPLVRLIESGTIFTAEEVEPLLDSTLPGMAEIAALLAIHDALSSGEWDEIVVDTAPFGHTLRLFGMPEAFARVLRFLEVAGSRDDVLAAHFGGRSQPENPLIGEWRQMIEGLVETLRRRARIVLVTSPEPFSLNESLRVWKLMREMQPPLQFAEIVLNRVTSNGGRCRRCYARQEESNKARAFLRKNFPDVAVHVGEDPGVPIIGAEALYRFGAGVFAKAKAPIRLLVPRNAPEPHLKKSSWPALNQELALSAGKGGVGKTTISAALAVHARRHSRREVVICSTDPAPSLDDVFREPVGDKLRPVFNDAKLEAAEIDAAAEFRAWAEEMKQTLAGALTTETRGLHVDLSIERRVFEALLDIVPPGVDEIFGVLRMGDVLRERPAAQLIIDMAPTGHALELLRTPERMLHWSRVLLKTLAAHRTLPFARDVGAEIAQFAARVRYLAARLRDPEQTTVCVVMLAEPLPDRETARLLRELNEIGVPLAALFVNRVLKAKDAAQCAHCRRRRKWQLATLAKLRHKGMPTYIIPEQQEYVSGRARLEALTKDLWQLA